MLDVLIRGEVEIETVVMHLFQVHVILVNVISALNNTFAWVLS